MAKLARLEAIVRGRVQGVGFRDYVVDRARSLGLAGHVRNLDDGASVRVEAEGERDDLERLVTELHRGPLGARVDEVRVAWSEYRGAFAGLGFQR